MTTRAVKRPNLADAPYYYEYHLDDAGDTLTFSAGAGGAHGGAMVTWGMLDVDSQNPVVAAVVLSSPSYVANASFPYEGTGWSNGRRTSNFYVTENAPFGCIRIEKASGTSTVIWHAVSDVPLSIEEG